MNIQDFKIKPNSSLRLADHNPGNTGSYTNKQEAKEDLRTNIERLMELQNVLYAEGKHALLIILQAMDAGGKDGVIRHVMGGLNPQGVHVASFKVPTPRELAHDYLWRIHKHTPGKGEISIFNRSHYEDVLVVRVHQLVSENVWSKRYDHINEFERLLADNGVTILKFFLNISKAEQKERFKSRLEEPDKRWKFSRGDLEERKLWPQYMKAFEDAISRCSTEVAPWFIVPSDKKWYRNLVVSNILVETMESLDMHYPAGEQDLDKVEIPD
ncbi:MAG: polyphosphate kinase 2 family protein [Anaerolineales bacterium]|nr:polyphosphate kinase 2 family protein [Anaerolineales bacterium]